MEMELDIDSSRCIRCGRCAKVCPSKIFVQPEKGADIRMERKESCIACGHCVAACPTASVVHSLFPDEKVHPVDRTRMPSPEQVMLLCRSRRSNRAFSSEPVPAQALDAILEAAHRAPTASNLQQVEFTLVTDPDKLRRVSDYTIGVFGSVVRKLENPVLRPLLRRLLPDAYRYLPNFHRLLDAYGRGEDLILRGATALLLIHTPAASRFGCQDANLAYQNASLMAESLGISQFYTGFVCSAVGQDRKAGLGALFGIRGKIHAGMALGMPEFRFPRYIDKEPIKVARF